MKLGHSSSTPQNDMTPESMDDLLAKLSEQQILLEQQKNALVPANDDEAQHQNGGSSSSSDLLTPATDSFSILGGSDEADNGDDTIKLDAVEMARLKKELDAAKDQIARQKQELDQTRVKVQTHTQAANSSSQHGFNVKSDASERSFTTGFANSNAGARSYGTRQDHWTLNEDARSDCSDALSAGVLNSASQNIWAASTRPAFNNSAPASANQQFQQQGSTWGQPGARPWSQRAAAADLSQLIVPQHPNVQQRIFSSPASPISSNDGRMMHDYNHMPGGGGIRRSNTQNSRSSSIYQPHRSNGWEMYPGGLSPIDSVNLSMNATSAFQSMGMYPASVQYQPRPIGTPLSPTAEEFRTAQPSATPWNAAVSGDHYTK